MVYLPFRATPAIPRQDLASDSDSEPRKEAAAEAPCARRGRSGKMGSRDFMKPPIMGKNGKNMGFFRLLALPLNCLEILSLPPMGLKNQTLQHLTVKYGISLWRNVFFYNKDIVFNDQTWWFNIEIQSMKKTIREGDWTVETQGNTSRKPTKHLMVKPFKEFYIPSGKHTKNYGKSQCLMGK